MSKLLFNRVFPEHFVEDISSHEDLLPKSILFKNKKDCTCICITQEGIYKKINATYYIGADWIYKNEVAICIAPKLSNGSLQIDYISMLFSCLQHPDVLMETNDLYEIKFEAPSIEIEQKQDQLTPLLIAHFLQLLRIIVRKGLKKSYYRVERNLQAKIKGRILIAKTLKQNIFCNNPTKNYCQYDEFGVNTEENKILKLTLQFIQKYLNTYPTYTKLLNRILIYCIPAFKDVDNKVDIQKIKNIKHNSFYKEYKEALHLASLILKRFGYNLKTIDTDKKLVKVPPYWINMPKLFELYVLGKLKDKYGNHVHFNIKGTYGRPDFLLTASNERMIIDTKYKPKYQQEKYLPEDIRQLSGYSRDAKVMSKLGYHSEEENGKVIDCLIVYPDQTAPDTLPDNLKEKPISGWTRFFKLAISLPVIHTG